MARPKASTTPASSKSHKRQLSSAAAPAILTPGSRTSKRLKESADNTPTNGKVTPKKSKYFEGSDGEDDIAEPTSEDVSESGYEDEAASATEASVPPDTSEDEDDSEEDTKPKNKRGRPASSKPGAKSISDEVSNKELWRQGVKTGLGPGKQVFIERPKPRGDGGIKYVPDRIHPNTMEFLRDLKKNNDREWLKMHDPDFRQSWKDWESFVESTTELIAEKDETIPELPPKDLVFRIYRDVRFSNDPTPYKPHFSAAWSRTGRKGPFACYYVQIKPGGESFVGRTQDSTRTTVWSTKLSTDVYPTIGSGLWMPEAQPLALLRTAINRKPHKFKEVLTDAAIRKSIFGGISNDETKVVKAFATRNKEGALKTKPKGYEADNPNIDLLRLRNFTIGKKLSDDEVISPKGLHTIADLIGVMVPFVTYLNSVVMPDDGASSSGEDDEEDAQEE